MTNAILALDGQTLEKIEPTAAERASYQPSKGRVVTQAQEERVGRAPVTRELFGDIGSIEQIGNIGDDDISSQYAYSAPPLFSKIVVKAEIGQMRLNGSEAEVFNGEKWIPSFKTFDEIKTAAETDPELLHARFDAMFNLGLSHSEVVELGTDVTKIATTNFINTEICKLRESKVWTGLPELDSMFHGFNKGGINLIGHQAGVGGSSFMYAMAKQMIQDRKPILYYDFEASIPMLYDKLDCSNGTPFVVGGPIFDLNLLIESIRKGCELMKSGDDVQAVFIDSLSMIDGTRGTVSEELRKLAVECNLAIFGTVRLPSRSHDYKGRPLWDSMDYNAVATASSVIQLERHSLGVTKVKAAKCRNAPYNYDKEHLFNCQYKCFI